jgi:hypothetical protein
MKTVQEILDTRRADMTQDFLVDLGDFVGVATQARSAGGKWAGSHR